MSDFGFYFSLGWEHIISRDALDHQLFILALAAIYLLKDWRQVLVLVTAFTIGHSLTLALTVLNIIHFPSSWIEFLIPCNLLTKNDCFYVWKVKILFRVIWIQDLLYFSCYLFIPPHLYLRFGTSKTDFCCSKNDERKTTACIRKKINCERCKISQYRSKYHEHTPCYLIQ